MSAPRWNGGCKERARCSIESPAFCDAQGNAKRPGVRWPSTALEQGLDRIHAFACKRSLMLVRKRRRGGALPDASRESTRRVTRSVLECGGPPPLWNEGSMESCV